MSAGEDPSVDLDGTGGQHTVSGAIRGIMYDSDPYELLGVDTEADAVEIQLAYRWQMPVG